MIVLTIVVRNEADIISANIEHHFAQGVDHILVVDNGSTDGTADILRRFEREGRLDVTFTGDVPLDKTRWENQLVGAAIAREGTDWIISTDADEFLTVEGGGRLADYLGAQTNARRLEMTRINMLGDWQKLQATRWQAVLRYRSMITQTPPRGLADPSVALQQPFFAHRLPDKVLFRGWGFQALALGAHDVTLEGSPVKQPSRIAVRHFPVRNSEEFLGSIPRFAEHVRSGRAPTTASGKYQRWAAMLELGRPPSDILSEAFPDTADLAEGIARGIYIEDPFTPSREP